MTAQTLALTISDAANASIPWARPWNKNPGSAKNDHDGKRIPKRLVGFEQLELLCLCSSGIDLIGIRGKRSARSNRIQPRAFEDDCRQSDREKQNQSPRNHPISGYARESSFGYTDHTARQPSASISDRLR